MHLPRPYAVLIGSRLWEFQRPYSWRQQTKDGWQIMGNYLYICPVCATAWARAWATDLPTDSIVWEVYSQPCERHTTHHHCTFPGSLFPDWWGYLGMRDRALFDHLPAELLQRELELHIRRFNING
jgi:hypothetical protein